MWMRIDAEQGAVILGGRRSDYLLRPSNDPETVLISSTVALPARPAR
jgi:hypothetical protein